MFFGADLLGRVAVRPPLAADVVAERGAEDAVAAGDGALLHLPRVAVGRRQEQVKVRVITWLTQSSCDS